ncbi:nucleotide-methyltransferase [Listeria floridensis FSL S10-1187]|uniref:Nucleotide-methyltransferase n=1 Tax=Listeria floridensis FSL S10-1187 TaxID=1265817 RepID=A0ABN0RGG1_9LIST|nr:hypothetical protein [Listeria floridensis]EUJ32985.1 nucleotide-methyltransferase [Listeria floridensis FSL S10-1187]
MKSKLEQNSDLIRSAADLFRCPICKEDIVFEAPHSLRCRSGHSFDLAKPGYLFLLRHAVKTKYDKSLFEARKRLVHTGFF